MQCHSSLPRVRKSSLSPVWAMGGRGVTHAGDVGDVADACGNTAAGIRSSGCIWVNGIYGNCLSFNFSSSGIATFPTLGSNFFNKTSPGSSIVSRIFVSALPSAFSCCFQQNRAAGISNYWGLWINPSNQWNFGSNTVGPTGPTVSLGWSTVGVTMTANLMQIMVIPDHGQLTVASQGTFTSTGNAAAFTMGSWPTGSEFFGGNISNCCVFNFALNLSQFTALAANPNAIYATPGRTRRRYYSIRPSSGSLLLAC
jgi:hypothetical protein